MSKIMLYQSLKQEMLRCEENVKTGRVSIETTVIVFEAFLRKLCLEYGTTHVQETHKLLNGDIRIIRTLKWLGRAGKAKQIIIPIIVKYFGTIRMMRVATLADDLDKLDQNNEGNV
jgi:hypothetical protein